MSEPQNDPLVERLVQALSFERDHERLAELFDERVVVHAFNMGRSGPMKPLNGQRAVFDWICKPPSGKFVFEALEQRPTEQRDDLPAGERALWVRYRVSLADPAFENFGDWWIHIRGDRIVAMRAEPNDLAKT